MKTFIMIISFILFAATVYSQNKPELKTNAKDTLTISGMFTTGEGVGEGIRMYKIVGRKYAYETYAVNVAPEFPGGRSDFNDKVYKKAEALYPETQRTFIIQFVIDYDGRPTEFRFSESEHPGIDRKLIKFIRSLAKWTPGIKDNKYVRVRLDFQYK